MTDPVTAPVVPGTPWFEGKVTDTAVIGHMTNRGWDKKDVVTAAIEAATAHMNAEKHIGVPVDQIIRLPKADDPAALKAAFVKLGAPEDAAKYDFTRVKKLDGAELDPGRVDLFRSIARDNFLTQTAAEKMAGALVKAEHDASVKAAAEAAATLAAENAELDKNWGANKEANMFIAKAAAAKFGPKIAAAVQALEGKAGYAAVLEMMREFGVRTGEDRFINSPHGDNRNVPMTVDGARSRKMELMKDTAFGARFLAGDADAKKEMAALDYIISGVKAA